MRKIFTNLIVHVFSSGSAVFFPVVTLYSLDFDGRLPLPSWFK
jgi:hypothetical protein